MPHKRPYECRRARGAGNEDGNRIRGKKRDVE